MTTLSPQKVYENLALLEQVGVSQSATYRQQAQAVLADPMVSLQWRLAIADRLNQANHLLTLSSVKTDESY